MSIAFERAKKTFLDYLVSQGKSTNTTKNYACDLTELAQFCTKKSIELERIGLAEFEAFHLYLRERGLKANSRRRKIMTAKSFLRYISGKVDLKLVGTEKFVPPEKVEKPPKLVSLSVIDEILDAQPETSIGIRNQALIRVLLETGMLVTEALALAVSDCKFVLEQGKIAQAQLRVAGPRLRFVTVGSKTAQALDKLTHCQPGLPYFFYGYSRSGPNPERLTARGVEVLFKGWATLRNLKHFHPRTLRHVFVVERMLQGQSEAQIMKDLGLRTPYAFRVYHPLVDSIRQSALTSAPQTQPPLNPA